MTSREHARRLMLILLASEGSALRKVADERVVVPREGQRLVVASAGEGRPSGGSERRL
jgi:hypothetical protein